MTASLKLSRIVFANSHSLGGKTKSLDESEAKVKRILSSNTQIGPSYQHIYLVQDIQEPNNPVFLGTVNLKGAANGGLELPAQLSLPGANDPGVLSLEIGYGFLPTAWGKGYATEALNALLNACSTAKSLWEPHTKLYVRAIVSPKNPASQGVVRKCGLTHLGDFDWTGDPVFVAGEWKDKDTVQIWVRMLER